MISNIINSAKKINPFGGIFFVINELKKKGLAKLIDYHLGKRVKQAKYSYSDILLNWTYCNLCGAERLEDIEKLRDSLDMKLPSHDALGTVMKSMSTKTDHMKTLKSTHQFNIHNSLNSLMINTSLKLGLLNKKESYTLDYDNTIITHHKYDRTKAYDRTEGYQPGVSFIGKIPVYIEGRNGNSNAAFKIFETVQRTLDILDEKGIGIKTFRSDAAAFNHQLMNSLDDRGIDFVIRYRKHKEMIEFLEWGGVEWDTIEIGGMMYGITSIQQSDVIETDKPYRIVVTRYKIKGEYAYRGIITNNTTMTDKEVVYFYNMRGAIERNFDDLKNNFNWGRLPFSFLNENTVFMIISAITYIIYQYLIRKFSKKVGFVKRKHRLKNFIFHFIICSSILINGKLQMFTDRNYRPLME